MRILINFLKFTLISILFNTCVINGIADWSSDIDPNKWNKQARETIENALFKPDNTNVAKNIIIFLGDGMGISTITAGRIYKGQKKNKNGEEEVTHMESLSHAAFSKVYSIDAQSPDSGKLFINKLFLNKHLSKTKN
jgi:alkaline phosphatase